MKSWFTAIALMAILCGALVANPAYGQGLDDAQGGAVEVTEPPSQYPAKGAKPTGQPQVGRKAAEKYMGAKPPGSAPVTARRERGPDAHYLAIHVGAYLSDNAYKWGDRDQANVGKWNFGVTYRVGEWVNSMDMGIRIDLSSYGLNEGRVNKLSFVPIIMFPDANSRFPLYFGAGIGPGIFLNQISSESSIALDYQLFTGVRFFDVFANNGFFVEAGIKNQFMLLSDGQFNGYFAALGMVFSF